MPSIAHLKRQTLGRVFYKNVLREGVTTYSGTPALGFEAINAYDWRDFSFFAPVAGTSTLETAPTARNPVDTAIVWRAAAGGTISALQLQVETAPASWSTIYNFGSPAVGLTIVTFPGVVPGVSRKFRWHFDTVANEVLFRQLFMGSAMEFPIGQHVGVTPPNLLQGIVVDNVINVNGSIIARNRRRVERRAEISLDHVTPNWVRAEWQPFAEHMSRYPCFYQWHPRAFPNEVVLAAAEDIKPPENATPVPLMKVSMPLRCVAD